LSLPELLHQGSSGQVGHPLVVSAPLSSCAPKWLTAAYIRRRKVGDSPILVEDSRAKETVQASQVVAVSYCAPARVKLSASGEVSVRRATGMLMCRNDQTFF
jgi:hypothetical protein